MIRFVIRDVMLGLKLTLPPSPYSKDGLINFGKYYHSNCKFTLYGPSLDSIELSCDCPPNGLTIEEIAKQDPSYLIWCMNEIEDFSIYHEDFLSMVKEFNLKVNACFILKNYVRATLQDEYYDRNAQNMLEKFWKNAEIEYDKMIEEEEADRVNSDEKDFRKENEWATWDVMTGGNYGDYYDHDGNVNDVDWEKLGF